MWYKSLEYHDNEITDYKTLDEFISQIDMSKIIKEASATGGVGADSGPAYAYGNFRSYRKRNIHQAKKLGWDVVNYILTSGDEINPKEYRTYPEGPVPAVSYAPAGVGGGLTPNNQFDLVGNEMLDAYQSHIDKVATTVGMELVDYLYGINQDLFKIIGSDAKQTDKTGNKAFSRITNRQKFGRDLAFMMAKDNLVFTMGGKNAPDHKITLKNEGRIGFRLPDYSSEAVDALEDFVKAGEILNKQIKGKTFEKDDPIVQQILVLLDDDTEGELNQLTQNLLDLVSELPDREERRKIGFNR